MIVYTRPKEYQINKGNIFAEMQSEYGIYQGDTKRLIDIHITPVLAETQVNGDGKPILPIDPNMFTRDKAIKFNRLTYSIGKINRLAESNLDKLKDFVVNYFYYNKFEEVTKRSSKCKELLEYGDNPDFKKLSFMQLKNVLSCIIKSDSQFYKIDSLDTTEKRSYFTKTYTEYIYDRDCYTHGQLFFHYPSYNPILRVTPPGKNEHYILLTEETLWSSLDVYQYFNSTLIQMSQTLDEIHIQNIKKEEA